MTELHLRRDPLQNWMPRTTYTMQKGELMIYLSETSASPYSVPSTFPVGGNRERPTAVFIALYCTLVSLVQSENQCHDCRSKI